MAIRVQKPALTPARLPTLHTGTESDEFLMEMMRRDDIAAYRRLMDRHRALFWRVMMKTLVGSVDRDDALQEIGMTIWNNRAQFQAGTAKPSTWLYRVAVNKCIDLNRASAPLHDEIAESHADTQAPNAQERMEQGDLRRTVAGALALIPLQQRLAVEQYFMQEKSVETIAAGLNTTPQAVRSLLKRGKESLKRQLTPTETAINL